MYAHTFVSIINSNWEICNGTLNNLIDNWCLWVQTQIIGPFWCRFWPGELNIGHYSLVWLLYRVVRLTCCSSAGSFLKHSPHHALYSRLFQSIRWLSYANDPLYPDGKWKSCAAEATGRKQWAAWTSEGSGGEQKRGEKKTQRKTKTIPFRQTWIIQQKMMSGWNNRVSCLSNFFCIFWISLKKIVYISYSNVSLYVYSAKCYYGKMLLYYQVLNSRTQLKHLK